MVDRRRTVLDVISNETKPTEEDFDDNQDLDNDNDNNFNGTELDREVGPYSQRNKSYSKTTFYSIHIFILFDFVIMLQSAKLEMLGLMNYPQSENLNMYYSNACMFKFVELSKLLIV